MSDRDHFTELSYKMLQKDDLAQQDRQFWVEYILRQLRGKDMIETYTLGDIIEWNFTGDNIVFTQEQLEIPISYLVTEYILDTTPAVHVLVRKMVIDGNYIYGVGSFENGYNGIADTGIWKYDIRSGAYYSIGSGVKYPHDIAIDSSGNILVVGNLTEINGDAGAVGGVAYWNGTLWAEVGTFGGASLAMGGVAVDGNDNFYICGAFVDIGDANGDRIVKWDGASFSSLATGRDNTVYCVATDASNNVYAGGAFTNYASVWGGSSWSDFSGFNGIVWNIVVDGTDIYFMGAFTTPYPYITKWDGSEFSGFGNGTGGAIVGGGGMTILSDGTVYVVNAEPRMYGWDGSKWTSLETDFPDAHSLVTDTNDNVYVGEWIS